MPLAGISVVVLPLGPSQSPGTMKSSPSMPSHTDDDGPVLLPVSTGPLVSVIELATDELPSSSADVIVVGVVADADADIVPESEPSSSSTDDAVLVSVADALPIDVGSPTVARSPSSPPQASHGSSESESENRYPTIRAYAARRSSRYSTAMGRPNRS